MRVRVGSVLVAGLGLVLLLGGASPAFAADPGEQVLDVDVDRVTAHLDAFQAIADANGGNRAVGTSGYEASGAYVERVLREAGYEPRRQDFEVVEQRADAASIVVDPPLTVTPVALEGTSGTPADGVAGAIVTAAAAEACDASDWLGRNVMGAIALVSRGTCAFTTKAALAAAAGALAVIVYNTDDSPLLGRLDTSVAAPPTLGIPRNEGLALAAAEGSGTVVATVDVAVTTTRTPTFNIIAESATGRADNTVILGAHLDSVPEGPGINDNASSSAALLEVAARLAQRGPLGNQVRFAWWGAEEVGLDGSTHYLEDLAATQPGELSEIAVYLNFDMIGSPNSRIAVYDANESTYAAPVEIPDGSVAANGS